MSAVVEKLESVGIKAKAYKRSPGDKDLFIVSRSRDSIYFWPGKAEVKVSSTNKKMRQAVLNVSEKERVVNTTASFYIGIDANNLSTEQDIADYVKGNYDDQEIIQRARISVPGAILTKHSYKVSGDYITIDITLTAPETKTSFLVGYDESKSKVPFICQLKTPVKNVVEAHKALLPEGVELKDEYKRQGEWFFNPVTDEKLNEQLYRLLRHIEIENLGGTSHYASTIDYKDKQYAIGIVEDTRNGHHENLILEGWYEVIRNNEVVTDGNNWD